ncbi:MAG: DUF2384 domain-containing protein [Niabella sp.]
MKNRKDTYQPQTEELPVVQEAALAYNFSEKNATGPLALMGLEGNRNIDNIQNTSDFINYIREGVPKKSLDHLALEIGLSASEIAAVIHTSERTLRRYTPAQKLNTEQSERVVELARLYAKGAEVFGDLEQFKAWMASPVGALGDKKPKEFLDTSMGIGMLTEELGRIEHGIFA